MDADLQLQLIQAVARGERQAFQELYEGTSGKLFGIAIQLMRSPERAEEALQEAFVKIWHNASEYHQGRGTVMTWMSSIVRYRCIDLLRSIRSKEDRQDSLDEEGAPVLLAPEVAENPDNQALERCMQTLESHDLQYIHLAYYRGMTHSEIQSHTGTPLGTVKSWIRRGLQRLKRCLEE
ncbi:sigma-70 family RNA polymerase sigma factor [Thalassolituus sp.]|jgi:RNA polymerase sigma-70 factor (ECF subfamily)|uniref:sigma-70 family RNA polymerase sigma factor n=1 Tax=Thalassolituus sp. TaxID=2030822 RepID=UPI002EB08FFE|nr:sigma-70 family RNA polymerase sigma factor [Pseudomonadota bacterium]MEC8102356.1 sigma-70 family RNA polymerase sigma factor [Pseudomonadota bacterium]MEC8524436.1 sigma-70 family RNA polymerase sigma factor [Pseudomonadota bacterium]